MPPLILRPLIWSIILLNPLIVTPLVTNHTLAYQLPLSGTNLFSKPPHAFHGLPYKPLLNLANVCRTLLNYHRHVLRMDEGVSDEFLKEQNLVRIHNNNQVERKDF